MLITGQCNCLVCVYEMMNNWHNYQAYVGVRVWDTYFILCYFEMDISLSTLILLPVY